MLRPNVVLDLLANTSYATHKASSGSRSSPATSNMRDEQGSNAWSPATEEGPNLALPGFGQVAADAAPGLVCTRPSEPDGDDLVDRIDLDSQSATFYANDAANLVKAESQKDLRNPEQDPERLSSPPSTSSVMWKVCSTPAAISSCWSTKPIAARREI